MAALKHIVLGTVLTVIAIGINGQPSTFTVTCPKGYQAFHTFHGPINSQYYEENAATTDCVPFENEGCVENCYWAGESHGRTRGDCSYWYDVQVTQTDIYFEGKKTVYARGFQYDGAAIDRAYCCVSKGSKTTGCQPKLLYYNSGSGSALFNTSLQFPNLVNPVTRSMDVEINTNSAFKYNLEVCETAYWNAILEAQCKPPPPTTTTTTTTTTTPASCKFYMEISNGWIGSDPCDHNGCTIPDSTTVSVSTYACAQIICIADTSNVEYIKNTGGTSTLVLTCSNGMLTADKIFVKHTQLQATDAAVSNVKRIECATFDFGVPGFFKCG